MTTLVKAFENYVEAERILREEINADALPDTDIDRVMVFDFAIQTVVLIARQGPTLDPQSAADMARGIDAVGMLIQQSAFARGDLSIRISLFSDVARDREFIVKAGFVRGERGLLEKDQEPGTPELIRNLRRVLEPAFPRGRCAETRVYCVRLIRETITNLRGNANKPIEKSDKGDKT